VKWKSAKLLSSYDYQDDDHACDPWFGSARHETASAEIVRIPSAQLMAAVDDISRQQHARLLNQPFVMQWKTYSRSSRRGIRCDRRIERGVNQRAKHVNSLLP